MEILKRAFIRTLGRFRRLGDSFVGELGKVHNEFHVHGCPLTLLDINMRSAKVATVASLILVGVTLPIIAYYRGISDTNLYFGLFLNFLFGWSLFYMLVMSAHALWIFSYIIGSKIGKSGVFWGFIEKRWGKCIDKITEDLLNEKSIKLDGTVNVPVHEFQKQEELVDDKGNIKAKSQEVPERKLHSN